MGINKSDLSFSKEWVSEMKIKLMRTYPSMSELDIEEKLYRIINTRMKDHPCLLDNNYLGTSRDTTLLAMTEFFAKQKPILAGYGVLFKPHDKSANASAGLLIESLDNRNKIKAERKKYPQGSYEFLVRDIGQGNEKVIANSYYGAAGADTSVFYNLYVAASTTGTGQALIATAETSFEALLEGNIKFFDLDECLLFINRVVMTDMDMNFKVSNPYSDDMVKRVVDRLLSQFRDDQSNNDDYRTMLTTIVSNLSKYDQLRLYFKNNLYVFLRDVSEVKELLTILCSETKSFRNPNKVPEEIEDTITTLWQYIFHNVCHIHPTRSRIVRDSQHTRFATVTQDTDSTMVTIAKYMELMLSQNLTNQVAAENEDELDFICCNIMAYILTRYSQCFLERYCQDVNMPAEQHKRINMKNEFYNLTMILTPKKKRYVSYTRLQEGQLIDPPMVKISGLDFIKSTTSDDVKSFFTSIIHDDILNVDEINVSSIIRKIKNFREILRSSFLNGELTYLNLVSAKEPEAYKKPYSQQAIKATIVWNAVEKNRLINLPEKIFIVKMDYKTEKRFNDNIDRFGDVADIIRKEIFESPIGEIAKGGITVVGIPQNIDRLPQWVIDTMDIDTMVDDIISKFNPILESLGDITLRTRSGTSHMSNIIDL